MRIVVLGGSGDLGARVVKKLGTGDHDVLAASRRTGVDLRTGDGLVAALDGADAVVHVATDAKRAKGVDVGGTRRVVELLHDLNQRPHVVAVSIVGCDKVPFPYYRAKLATEQVLVSSGLPATVQRATQFHALAALMATRIGPLAASVRGLRFQPVDIDWVAAVLAELAVGPAPEGPRRAEDLAGPEVLDSEALTRVIAEHDGRIPPRLLTLPALAPLASLGAGALLPESGRTGGRTFAQWLSAQPIPLPRRFHDPT